MSRYAFIINGNRDRERAAKVIAAAPTGTRVEVKAAKRTMPQNDRMWAMLTEISRSLKWHGRTLRPDDWKIMFLDALKRETDAVPNLDGTGMVDLGWSSSDLTKSEMSDMIELMFEFGARNGVQFREAA